MVEYRRPTRDDLLYIAKHMRGDDRIEIGLCYGNEGVYQVLHYSVTMSIVAQVAVDAETKVPMCVFGVQSINTVSGIGLVWMLGTGKGNKFTIARESKRMLRQMFLPGVEVLVNKVWNHHNTAVKWLDWLGAHFVDSPFVQDEVMVPFVLSRKRVLGE